MELDELLALMAAQIYATGMTVQATRGVSKEEWSVLQPTIMQAAVTEARMIWEIAHATKGKVE